MAATPSSLGLNKVVHVDFSDCMLEALPARTQMSLNPLYATRNKGDLLDDLACASQHTKETNRNDLTSPTSIADVFTMPATSRKRHRMSKEDRKVRHREVQRQFMKRKRARIAVLRQVQMVVEKQLRLIKVTHEIEKLIKENAAIVKQLEIAALEIKPPTVAVSLEFGDLVFSVPSQDTPDELMVPDFDWSDILDLLTVDGGGDESDMTSM